MYNMGVDTQSSPSRLQYISWLASDMLYASTQMSGDYWQTQCLYEFFDIGSSLGNKIEVWDVVFFVGYRAFTLKRFFEGFILRFFCFLFFFENLVVLVKTTRG